MNLVSWILPKNSHQYSAFVAQLSVQKILKKRSSLALTSTLKSILKNSAFVARWTWKNILKRSKVETCLVLQNISLKIRVWNPFKNSRFLKIVFLKILDWVLPSASCTLMVRFCPSYRPWKNIFLRHPLALLKNRHLELGWLVLLEDPRLKILIALEEISFKIQVWDWAFFKYPSLWLGWFF